MVVRGDEHWKVKGHRGATEFWISGAGMARDSDAPPDVGEECGEGSPQVADGARYPVGSACDPMKRFEGHVVNAGKGHIYLDDVVRGNRGGRRLACDRVCTGGQAKEGKGHRGGGTSRSGGGFP